VTALTAAIVPVLATAGVPVGIGEQPANVGAKPFVVIWPDGGLRYAATMKANDGLDETWTCHCYGLTPEAADVAMRKFTAAVYGLWRTTVAGRVVQYPEQLTALPLSIDRDAEPDLYDLTVEWRFRTSA
jgi:hypothetical protein